MSVAYDLIFFISWIVWLEKAKKAKVSIFLRFEVYFAKYSREPYQPGTHFKALEILNPAYDLSFFISLTVREIYAKISIFL